MVTRNLYRSQWGSYFAWITRQAENRRISVQIVGQDGRLHADALELRRVTYDAGANLLEVHTHALDHVIEQPVRIYVDESADSLTSIEVVQSDGARQLIRLDQPLSLPPAGF